MANTRQGGKKQKRPDNRPARKRYWMLRTLETRKVGKIFKGLLRAFFCDNGKRVPIPAEERKLQTLAHSQWHKTRKGRVPDGYIVNEKYLI